MLARRESTTKTVVVALAGGVLVAVVMALGPITGYHGDAEQSCGNLMRHTQVPNATPATVASKGYPATPGNSGTAHFDACPPEDYQARRSTLTTAAPIATVALGVFGFAASRRRLVRQR
jgi:hypothetical protein